MENGKDQLDARDRRRDERLHQGMLTLLAAAYQEVMQEECRDVIVVAYDVSSPFPREVLRRLVKNQAEARLPVVIWPREEFLRVFRKYTLTPAFRRPPRPGYFLAAIVYQDELWSGEVVVPEGDQVEVVVTMLDAWRRQQEDEQG